MTPTPEQIAALAEALQSKEAASWLRLIVNSTHGKMAKHERLAPGIATDFAGAILTALPGWTLVPTGEIERLRAALEWYASAPDLTPDIGLHARTALAGDAPFTPSKERSLA